MLHHQKKKKKKKKKKEKKERKKERETSIEVHKYVLKLIYYKCNMLELYQKDRNTKKK
jgi:hypothetical protein